MRQTKAAASFSLLSFVFVLLVSLSSCKPDPCEDQICAPCPSSRFVMVYQDSTGACLPDFHSNAIVYAIDASTMDTAYNYNFSDSCEVGFLVQEDLVYHVVSGAVSDVIQFTGFDYQDPISVTECCLCYPINTVAIQVNGLTDSVTFNAGEYQNTPYIRRLN